MKKSEFYYELPEKLIAQHPSPNRDKSRLMVLKPDRTIEDKYFYEIVDFLRPGDCLVINNTKVIPARLFGRRKDTGSEVEFLLIKELSDKKYEVLVRPGKKCRVGHQIVFANNILEAEIIKILSNGNRIVQFKYEGIWQEILAELGEMPLPPYITEKLVDKNRYQTIYAKHDGSSAAPTAGLHFTEEIFEKVKTKGVRIAEITLHVGIGTFRPVKEENIKNHFMHHEHFQIDQKAATIINKTKENNGRIICVGTTSCRVLETLADPKTGRVVAAQGETDIFIYPGYKFKILDGLITNFHLPESTLLMLVSAFYGKDDILDAYQHAIDKQYRFFSFGDAMFILPKS